MFYLKQSTSMQYIRVLLIDNDGDPVTGVTSPTITIAKNNGSFAAANDGAWSEQSNGWYLVRIDATDSETIGPLQIHVEKTGCQNFDDQGYVLPVHVYGGLFIGNDYLQVDAVQIGSDSSKTGLIDAQLSTIMEGVDSNYDAIDALNDPSPADIADAVWDEIKLHHTLSGSTGEVISKFNFNSSDDVKATLDNETVSLTTPISISAASIVGTDGTLELYHGVDYTGDNTKDITIANYEGFDFTGGTGELRILDEDKYNADTQTADKKITINADNINVSDNGNGTYDITVTISITKTDLDDLDTYPPNNKVTHVYQLWLTTSDGESQDIVAHGSLIIRKDVT